VCGSRGGVVGLVVFVVVRYSESIKLTQSRRCTSFGESEADLYMSSGHIWASERIIDILSNRNSNLEIIHPNFFRLGHYHFLFNLSWTSSPSMIAAVSSREAPLVSTNRKYTTTSSTNSQTSYTI